MERSSSRLKVLALLVAFMFAALSVRLWFLQVLAVEANRDRARNNSVRRVETDALRGNIWDARGPGKDREPLVGNRESLEVRVNQQRLGPNGEEVLLRLSELLEIPVKEIVRKLQDERYYKFQPIPVAEFVPEKVKWFLDEYRSEFPGVEVVQTSVRDYPAGSTAAHVLGWVAQISREQLEAPAFRNYGQSDVVGKFGLEQAYERFLRGDKGVQRFIVNADGETIRALAEQAPTPGNDLVLSVDSRIQRATERQLLLGIQDARRRFDEDTERNLRANSGSAIVMDPDTGGIVAMASLPSFDPRWFVEGLSKEQDAYLFDPNSTLAPTLSRATQLTFAPGSTFKPFVALAAVKEGLASLGGYYSCPPSYNAATDPDGRGFGNWSTSDLGPMTIQRSLQVSCDTVYYQWGDQFWQRQVNNQLSANSEPFQRDLRQWGFGRPTGIDLPSEAGGLVPDARWKEEYARENPELFLPDERTWLPGDSILMSIGGGSMLTTPLQLAVAYSAIANGGKICRPHLMDHIVDADGNVVKNVGGACQASLPYSQGQLDYIRNALGLVTQGDGTAAGVFATFPQDLYPVAGKTGTAERGSAEFQDTSWFASMVPANDPEYVVVVMVEQGGFGAETAAPIARRIIEEIYGIESVGPIVGESKD